MEITNWYFKAANFLMVIAVPYYSTGLQYKYTTLGEIHATIMLYRSSNFINNSHIILNDFGITNTNLLSVLLYYEKQFS